MNTLSLAFLNLAVSLSLTNCVRAPGPMDDDGSALASVTVGTVKQEVVEHDSMQLSVTIDGQEKTYDNTKDDFSKIAFQEGTTVSLRMALFQDAMMKARTSNDPDSQCPPTVLTLKAGDNQAKIRICLAGSDTIAESDGVQANVSLDVCVAGKDCDDAQSANTGRCKEEKQGTWANLSGGCQYLGNGKVYSAISNEKGVTVKFMDRPQAADYCKSLVEGNQSDWRLPTVNEMREIGQAEPLAHLQTLDVDRSSMSVWIQHPDDKNVLYIPTTSDLIIPQTPESVQDDLSSSGTFYAFCVRDFIKSPGQ